MELVEVDTPHHSVDSSTRELSLQDEINTLRQRKLIDKAHDENYKKN
ncbi:MAG: hypothetical protein K8S27_16375 [Candidatus Omnitrophica bacterium]|nr:hypothetical protein [Candidatus Omnitrophota bacterium]